MKALEIDLGAEDTRTLESKGPPELTLLIGGGGLEVDDAPPPSDDVKQAIGISAMGYGDMRRAYMPGYPAWNDLRNCQHGVHGMVYPH